MSGLHEEGLLRWERVLGRVNSSEGFKIYRVKATSDKGVGSCLIYETEHKSRALSEYDRLTGLDIGSWGWESDKRDFDNVVLSVIDSKNAREGFVPLKVWIFGRGS